MKKNKIIYWSVTCLAVIPMLISGIIYLVNPTMIEATHPNMGFPNYFKTELGIAKIIGSVAVLLPMIPHKIKEFGYAGLAIVLVSASYTHFSINDTLKDILVPILILGLLAVSYSFYNKTRITNNH